MSKASEFGVNLIERMKPLLVNGTHDYDEPEQVAGDHIAYWLHWVESKGGNVDEAVRKAYGHWDAERGEGDDIANDPTYDDLIEKYRP